MIDAGLAATLVAVDLARLSADFVGRPFDRRLLADLPPGVDPCGERGEFHTLVTGGPGFARSLAIDVLGVYERDGHAYAELRHRR
jgi:diphthamide synthase (EF-2-diphthine--ammonia ligase)